MTETTEESIARLAKERAKTILENGDFWGSPGAANTSAQAITTLIAVDPTTPEKKTTVGDLTFSHDDVSEIIEKTKAKRQPKESPATVTNEQPEPADA